MAARKQLLGAMLVALIGGVLLFGAPLRAQADPTPLACPNGQTVFLEGDTTPREALLVFLGNRAVGGGIADSTGNYRLPLRPQEKPGEYPVEVRLRATRAVVDRFTCFVDVPVGGEGTPTPSPAPTSTPPPAATRAIGVTPSPTTAGTARPGATSASTTAAGTPSVTRTSGGTASATPTGSTATPSTTRTGGPSPTPTRTVGPGTPSPTVNPTPQAGAVVIDDVIIDAAFPDNEFVQIRNADERENSFNLAGWRVINVSRSNVPPYTFPDFLLEENAVIALYSGSGQNDLDFGDFFWNQSGSVWNVGDRAELRDAQNRLIHFFIVPEQ